MEIRRQRTSIKETRSMGSKNTQKNDTIIPILKTVEQMAKISGIGENTLRRLMDEGKLEYVQNGNRRLIADKAIWKWYKRNKVDISDEHRKGA